MTRPTLSVVLPTRNHAHLVGRAIHAIGAQSWAPVELLVVDDASTDETPAVLAALAAKYPFMQVLRNERNLGVAGAFNEALRRARGDFVYGASSDDWVLPDAFAKAMALATDHPLAGAIFGAMFVLRQPTAVFAARSWKRPLYVPPDVFVREYLQVEGPGFALGGATFFRREPFLEVGGLRAELGSYCDTFAFRALGATYGACYVPEPLMVWNVQHESFSQSTGRDPWKYLELIGRVAALMRSEPFCHVFPAEHTNRWEREYREETCKAGLEALHRAFDLTITIHPLLRGDRGRALPLSVVEPLLASVRSRVVGSVRERLGERTKEG
jgi:glycosyltransferase involved in cell wall biosynthesis